MKNLLTVGILLISVHWGVLAVKSEDTDLNAESLDLTQYELVEDDDDSRYSKEAENNEETNFLGFGDSKRLITSDTLSPATLEKICRDLELQIYLSQDDLTIDCVNYQESVVMVKRDLSDQLDVEGSGDNEPDVVEDAQSKSEPATSEKEAQENSIDPPAVAEESKTLIIEEIPPEDERRTGDTKENPDNHTHAGNNEIVESDIVEPATIEKTKEDLKANPGGEVNPAPEEVYKAVTQYALEIKPPTDPTEDDKLLSEAEIKPDVIADESSTGPSNISEEVTVSKISADTTTSSTPISTPPEVQSSEENKSSSESPLPTSSPVVPSESVSEGSEPVPLKNEETAQEAENKSSSVSESAATTPAAVVPENPGFEAKAESDVDKKGKTLGKSSGIGEDPVQHGSTEDTTKKASKDTTILICLFVAVVVVGALAFGYNFVKKRRRQTADLERVERGPSSIKRSLQSLTKAENEPEKKPLINASGAAGKDQEMVEMKKRENGNVGENERDDDTQQQNQNAKTT